MTRSCGARARTSRPVLDQGQEPGDSDDLEDPDVIAAEIADDLEAALEQFAAIANDLREREER